MFDLDIFKKADLENGILPPLKCLEIMNNKASLFEIKNIHLFETVQHLSVHYLDLDLFN